MLALTIELTLLDQSGIQLNFDASVDADADDWCEWYIETSVFLLSLNANVIARVNGDDWCK